MRSVAHLIMIRFLVFTLCLWAGPNAFAQQKGQPSFVSPADAEVSVKNVLLAPFSDNVGGIYANPLNDEAKEILAKDPRWNLVVFPSKNVKIENLEERTDEVRGLLRDTKADALLTGRIVKGPAGITLKVTLNAGSTGQPLIIEEANDPEGFETARIRRLFADTLAKLRSRMPYRGTVLSRKGQQITIDIGKNSGQRDGAEISIIQILKIERHPKKGFLVSTEKEILGKARIFKADEELSFANILFEKEAGVVVPGMKILTDDVVAYPEPIDGRRGEDLSGLSDRKDKDVAFGEKPVEWLPEPPPQYGRVQILAGLGQYTQSANLVTDGGIDGSNSMTPNLGLSAEGWIDKNWFLSFDLRQSAFSIPNDLAGSSPGKLNVSLSKYSVAFGRNFLLSNDFFGPKMQLTLGMGKFSARIDQSTPVLFSNTEYGGMHLGFVFNMPLSDDVPWDLGARMKYYLSPGVTETIDSGSTKSVSAGEFGFMLAKRVRQNFRYVGELAFDSYNADFTAGGTRPATSVSHKATTLYLGLEYLF